MNPKAINSTNVIQFGVRAVFVIEDNKIRFDIAGLTLFNAGGAAAVQGISFEVIDPSGVKLSTINFAAPHIDPDVTTTYELDMPSGISKFGFYKIKAAIKEANGTEYSIELPPKQVCQPENWNNEANGVDGTFDIKVDCQAPYIRVSETTPFSYQSLSPYSKSKNGTLYYPQGTVAPIPFTFTPFESPAVYTGTYTVRNKTTVRYNLQDNVFVDIPYKTSLEKRVTCQSSILDIMCCLEKNEQEMEMYCNSPRGAIARKKHEAAVVPLIRAIAMERAGQDASKEIDKIRDILDCDCNCGPKLIEPKLAGATQFNYVFEGQCATTASVSAPVGNVVNIGIKTKYTQLIKSNPADLAYSIKRTEDDCNVFYAIEFDYNVLTSTIINTIKNTQSFINELVAILNSDNDVDLTGLDGKCVIDLTKSNYTAVVESNAFIIKLIKSIVINGQTYAAPANLVHSDDVAVKAWLDSLALGVWTVSIQAIPDSDGTIVVIQSNANINKPSTITILNQTTGLDEVYQFASFNISIKNILQAIIDYVCTPKATQIETGVEYNVCTIDENGAKKQTSFGSSALLSAVITAMNAAICRIIDILDETYRLTCDKIKNLFPSRNTSFDIAEDFFLGTKRGACSRLTADEVAKTILVAIQNNPVRYQEFCTLAALCNTGIQPDLPEVVGIIGTVGTNNINITGINWSIVPSANQVVSIWYRPCPSGGNTPAFILVNGNAVALPNGNLQAAQNINPVNPASCYEVMIKNNAGGVGYVRVFNTLAVSSVNTIKIQNEITGSNITIVEFNNVDLLQGVPIATGNSNGYDIAANAGVPHTLEIETSGAGAGQEMVWEHRRNGSLIGTGYFTYNGVLTAVGVFTFQAGDEILFARANRHLVDVHYAAVGGTINGICDITGILVTRDSLAVADATHANKSVRVTVEVTADNGCTAQGTVDLPANSAGGTFNLSLNCNGTPCSTINTYTIISIIEL